ncbi:MAG: hypothetical protein ABI920_02295 [Casimicrobiaceae bacterium]
MRARILSRMLAAVGPLALLVVSGGTFAKFVEQARWAGLTVSVEDAARVSANQVFEIASYVQQSNPAVMEQVLAVLTQDLSTTAALGSSVAVAAFGILSARAARSQPGK